MDNKKFLFASLLFVCTYVNASNTQNDDALTSTFDVSQGYRHDKLVLKSSTFGYGSSSSDKVKFKDVDTYTTRLSATFRKNNFFLQGIAGYGNIYDGKMHNEIYYANPTRHYDYTKSAHVTGDYTADFAIAFGKEFQCPDSWIVAPSIGYGVYIQDFTTNHGKLASKHSDINGKGSKEHYKATWYSPQAGLTIQKALASNLNAYATYKFLFPLSYHASGHYNTKFKKGSHYEQDNKAYKSLGNIGTIGLAWNFAKNWSLKPEFEFMKFYSKESTSRIKLKRATRTASEYRLVLSYMF